MVTAKDKLRELLSKGMDGIAVSAEKADEVSAEVNGIDDIESLAGPKPSIYSGEASLYALRVGVELLAAGRADFLYLSLTDYMQHKYAPEAPESREFYRGIDAEVGRLLDLGAVVGITADHGMNAKCNAAGEPNVIYLETELACEFGDGCRVICPITDPYVVHHGALGSAVTVYLPDNLDRATVTNWIAALNGVTEVRTREAAVAKLELPGDRIGDLFVLSGRDWVIGRMLAEGYVNHMEADSARSTPFRVEPRTATQIFHAAYFTEEVRRKLINRYGTDRLYGGGLSVRTTLDPVSYTHLTLPTILLV